jgi:hypothetical protein
MNTAGRKFCLVAFAVLAILAQGGILLWLGKIQPNDWLGSLTTVSILVASYIGGNVIQKATMNGKNGGGDG